MLRIGGAIAAPLTPTVRSRPAQELDVTSVRSSFDVNKCEKRQKKRGGYLRK